MTQMMREDGSSDPASLTVRRGAGATEVAPAPFGVAIPVA